jgi:hypothetical protein
MASKKVIVTECDVCESTSEITTYTITKGGSTKRTKIDLCSKDSTVLENLIKMAPKATPGRQRTPRVTSIEDIEALKKPAKKTAKKAVTKKVAAAQ